MTVLRPETDVIWKLDQLLIAYTPILLLAFAWLLIKRFAIVST